MAEVLDRKTIKALAADSRQTIMKMLTKRPYTASEIAKATGKHVTTVTEHLDTLESSGLIRKKESTNKWVYYELTPKGEHLFKPQLYSWVIVFAVSAVVMFTGVIRLLSPGMEFNAAAGRTAISELTMPMAADTAEKTTQIAQIAAFDFLAYGLIGLGLIGFTFLAYKKYFPGKTLA